MEKKARSITTISIDTDDWEFCHEHKINVSQLLRSTISNIKGDITPIRFPTWKPLTPREEEIAYYRARAEEHEAEGDILKANFVRNKLKELGDDGKPLRSAFK